MRQCWRWKSEDCFLFWYGHHCNPAGRIFLFSSKGIHMNIQEPGTALSTKYYCSTKNKDQWDSCLSSNSRVTTGKCRTEYWNTGTRDMHMHQNMHILLICIVNTFQNMHISEICIVMSIADMHILEICIVKRSYYMHISKICKVTALLQVEYQK